MVGEIIYEERLYRAFSPAEFYRDTNNFLHNKGFYEIDSSETFIFTTILREPASKGSEHIDRMWCTITTNGLVILTYDSGFVERNEANFSPHRMPWHFTY
jgi:hypothetical protein